jgi:hypothetical protein
VLTYGKRNSGIRLTAFVMSSVFFVYKINFRSFDSATAPAVRPLVLRNLEVDGRIIINIGMFMLVSILYYNFFQKKKPKGDDKK